jgi:hypothetical protein
MHSFVLVQAGLRELDQVWGVQACCESMDKEEYHDVDHGSWVTRCND